jgi:uncharacterized alkaline shock family protein YloU
MTVLDTQTKTTISPEVLLTISRLAALKVDGVRRMAPLPVANMPKMMKRGHFGEGVAIEIVDNVFYADLYVIMANGVNVREVSRVLQNEIGRAIREMVGMTVGRINIHIEDIEYPIEGE